MQGITHAGTSSIAGVAREFDTRAKSVRGPSDTKPTGSPAMYATRPAELRRREFVFGMASEVMQLIDGLPRQAVVWSARDGDTQEQGAVDPDELVEAFLAAKQGLD